MLSSSIMHYTQSKDVKPQPTAPCTLQSSTLLQQDWTTRKFLQAPVIDVAWSGKNFIYPGACWAAVLRGCLSGRSLHPRASSQGDWQPVLLHREARAWLGTHTSHRQGDICHPKSTPPEVDSGLEWVHSVQVSMSVLTLWIEDIHWGLRSYLWLFCCLDSAISSSGQQKNYKQRNWYLPCWTWRDQGIRLGILISTVLLIIQSCVPPPGCMCHTLG